MAIFEVTSNEKIETNVVEVEFKINAEHFEKAVQTAFLKKRKDVNIPGFRRGKATRKMIEATYGEEAFYPDAVNELYRETIADLIDELKLDIVDDPDVEVVEVGKEKGVTFKGKFTVKPDVVVGVYTGLKVEVPAKKVTEEDIDEQIEKVRNNMARLRDVTDRATVNGDTVVFDFAGFCEGEAFSGGTAEKFKLEIGGGRFIPGFEEQMVGKNIGEDFDVNVVFPEDYPSEAVRGKDAVFKCKIHEISGKEIADFDDEFVKDVSEFDTVEEYRADLRKRLEKENEKLKEAEAEKEIAEKIIASMEGEIPPVMFEDRIDEMMRDWSLRYNMSPEDYSNMSGMSADEFREGFREVAEKQVKFRLALEKIAILEDFKTTDDEVNEEYAKMAENYRMSEEKVRKMITPDAVSSDLKAEKALAFVKEKTTIISVDS